jgi:hypothetical protein
MYSLFSYKIMAVNNYSYYSCERRMYNIIVLCHNEFTIM